MFRSASRELARSATSSVRREPLIKFHEFSNRRESQFQGSDSDIPFVLKLLNGFLKVPKKTALICSSIRVARSCKSLRMSRIGPSFSTALRH
jgi:hypothetical protein